MIQKLLFTLLFLVSSLGVCEDNRPNIVVIMLDDMGFSDIGCYGAEIPTPHLDSLAENGAKFSQFYNTGRCCPTRASLLTGLYAHQAGMGWMTADHKLPGYGGQLNEKCTTIAEVLGNAGYFTAITGKWHVGYSESVNPTARGFHRSLNLEMGGVHFSNQSGKMKDRKLHLNGEEIAKDDPRLSPPWYGSDLWTDWGIKFLDEAIAEEKPYFLYLAHVAPHFPCMAPEETIAKYRGKYKDGWDVLREKRHQRQIDSGLIDPSWKLAERPDDVPSWDSLSVEKQTRYDDMMAIYAAMIEEVDKNVGKLVHALEERGELDNTLILFLTDNGGNAETGVAGKYDGEKSGDPHSNVYVGKCWAHLNNTPFRLYKHYKHYNHEGGTASPLIAHWPEGKVKSNGWITTPTHVIELMATCVDLGKATYPESRNGQAVFEMKGQSLKPLLTERPSEFEKRTLFWEHEGNAAVREGDDKLVRVGTGGKWELYDLAKDRTEQNDLVELKPERARDLQKQFEAWAKRTNVIPRPARLRRSKK